ncbi:PQQ-binding-like beta-propeller repeat protein [Actinoplanes sp. Pm04-4]|uniref:PQQ-binding-like beta-propeller repeat protein n=1 Tax=Paractinoplanes pyxinae TaxID=2997416 RepID=A0ABT4B8X0_9ACTN|nr:PQQ-binding-like beta-propeller repeat protein [Actinoplanes pyxinae]MCY1142078.1 PQQ-binding-like beta-propeller repeat protein [Actinoplanes pyxinae]
MTIDLDVAPAGRAEDRLRRTRSGALVVAVLVLLLVGASAPPAYAAEITPVLEGDGRGITASLLTGTAVFTQHGEATDQSSDVWARPVVPGGPEWITKVAGLGTGLWLDRSGTVLVSESGDAGETTFLDARTGRTRWKTGQYSSVRPVGAAVTDWVPPDLLRVRHTASGRVLWSHPARAFAVDERQRYVVVFDVRRRPTVLSAADGRVVARSGQLDFEWNLDYPAPFAPVRMIGDNLVTVGATAIAAYRLTDLTPLWRTPIARPAAVTGCGGRICAFSTGGLAVVDPADGAVRWSSERWHGLVDSGVRWSSERWYGVADGSGHSAHPAGGQGVLLDEAGRVARVDLATGRVVAELGRGEVLGGLQLVDGGGGRTLVRDLAGGRVLGEVSGIAAGTCTAATDLFACRTADSRFRVWRIGRA